MATDKMQMTMMMGWEIVAVCLWNWDCAAAAAVVVGHKLAMYLCVFTLQLFVFDQLKCFLKPQNDQFELRLTAASELTRFPDWHHACYCGFLAYSF